MFAKSSTSRLLSKIDASHTPGKKYKTTAELMRGPSADMVQWRETRADLSRQIKETSDPKEKSRLKGELLGEIAFGKPMNEYATNIEPLPKKSAGEIAFTSGGKVRSPAGQKIMEEYLKYTGRFVPSSNSSRR